MSRVLRFCLRAQHLGPLALAVAAVTGVACNRHEVTNTMSSHSVAEGQSTAGQSGAPAATAAGVGMATYEGGNSGHPGAMGGTSGSLAMAGTGGTSGVIQVAMKTPGASPAGAQEDSAATILSKLHQTDLKEIEMGKLAEKEGTSKEVKSYATMLVRDHTAADKRIMAFAKAENLDLAEGETHDMGTMKPEVGAGFDAAFASEMLHDHQRDVADVTEVRDSTKDKKLKSLLSSLLPVLEKHEQTAQKIVDHVGAKQK